MSNKRLNSISSQNLILQYSTADKRSVRMCLLWGTKLTKQFLNIAYIVGLKSAVFRLEGMKVFFIMKVPPRVISSKDYAF